VLVFPYDNTRNNKTCNLDETKDDAVIFSFLTEILRLDNRQGKCRVPGEGQLLE
jgi:hypothetical protein